jgi:hypothetical protein
VVAPWTAQEHDICAMTRQIDRGCAPSWPSPKNEHVALKLATILRFVQGCVLSSSTWTVLPSTVLGRTTPSWCQLTAIPMCPETAAPFTILTFRAQDLLIMVEASMTSSGR